MNSTYIAQSDSEISIVNELTLRILHTNARHPREAIIEEAEGQGMRNPRTNKRRQDSGGAGYVGESRRLVWLVSCHPPAACHLHLSV